MSELDKVSPRPWRVEYGDIIDAAGDYVLGPETNENIAMPEIVRAVNNFERMVEALEECRLSLMGLLGDDDPSYPVATRTLGETFLSIEAALAAAKEGK